MVRFDLIYLLVGEIAGEVETAGHVSPDDHVGFFVLHLLFDEIRHGECDLASGSEQSVLSVARRLSIDNILSERNEN